MRSSEHVISSDLIAKRLDFFIYLTNKKVQENIEINSNTKKEHMAIVDVTNKTRGIYFVTFSQRYLR